MKKLLFIIALSFAFNASATNFEQFKKQHKQKKQQLFASLDYCSNLGSKEIFELGTKDLEEIYTYRTKVKNKFERIKQEKTNCFDNSLNFLNDIIADNFIFITQSEDNELFELQNKIDQRLYESIKLRKDINISLIESLEEDTESSIEKTAAEKRKDTFISESSKTKQLISQELNVIYDSLEDQLKLDQSNIDLSAHKDIDIVDIANVTLRGAFLNLSRALLLFEHIEQEPKAYNIAKINTFVESANNKLLELKAFSSDLDQLDSKQDINKIINQLAIVTVDLDTAIKEMNDDDFSENFLAWAANLYQKLSDIVTQTQKVLDTVYLIDITKQALPIDITIKNEELSYAPIQAIKAPVDVLEPIEHKQQAKSKDKQKKANNNA